MNYVVLGLGILLTAAGCLSLYAGYDIIEIERGWAEVIAGVTAASAGIITIALSMILMRLTALGELYKASQRPAPARSTFAPAIFNDDITQAVPRKDETFLPDEPVTAATPSLSSALSSVTISEPAFEHEELAPIATFAEPAAETRLGDPAEVEAPLPEPIAEPEPVKAVREENPIREKMKAVFRRNTGVRRPLAKPAPIEPMVEETQAAMSDALLAADAPEVYPAEETVALPSLPKVSTSALSLDEMWKRVSSEIEEPIFPAPSKSFATAAPEIKISHEMHSASAPDLHVETLSTATEVPVLSATAVAEDHLAEAAPLLDNHLSVQDEYDAPQENAPRLPRVFSDFAHTPAADPEPTVVDEPEYLPEPEPYTPPPLRPAPEPAPVAAAPAMIGRYEAEGTAYLMFADGSIEAQSEAGIFHFASMAELKAFIETKQAAET